jgi:hypothetical protein
MAGLVTLSSIVQRRVWIDFGPFEVFPNVFAILVGLPGVKKTTAMNFSRKVLKHFDNVPLSSSTITTQAMLKEMGQNAFALEGLDPADPKSEELKVFSPYTVMASELSNFLRHGAEDMIDVLTGMYDESRTFDCRTKNMGTDVIEGPYITLLGGTTPSWISKYMQTDVLKGGFLRRCLFVFEAREKPRIAFPVFGPENYRAMSALVAYGKLIQTKLRGPMKWQPEAREFYVKWYEGQPQRGSDDEFFADYLSTKHMHVLRLAMLFNISQGLDMTLKVVDLEFALELLNLVEKNFDQVFSGVGRNELAAATDKILRVLELKPLIDVRELQAKLWRDVNQGELSQCMMQLEQIGKVQRVQAKLRADGPMVICYKLVKK